MKRIRREHLDYSSIVTDWERGMPRDLLVRKYNCSRSMINKIINFYQKAKAGDADSIISAFSWAPSLSEWAAQFLPNDKQTLKQLTSTAPPLEQPQQPASSFPVPEDVQHRIAVGLVEMTRTVNEYGPIDSEARRAYWAGAMGGISLMADVFVLLMKPKKAVQHGEEV